MDWNAILFDQWPVKFVSIMLIWAAYIDGKQLKVPNWMTFPMVLSGLAYNIYDNGYAGFTFAFYGMSIGLLTLLPLYAVGGMGAGDVKLMAGIGAWLGAAITWYAFVATVIVGAVMAVIMAFWSGNWEKHYAQFFMIWNEWMAVKNPVKLAEIAKERKPRMFLLPYGIPICIGSLIYFVMAGLYV